MDVLGDNSRRCILLYLDGAFLHKELSRYCFRVLLTWRDNNQPTCGMWHNYWKFSGLHCTSDESRSAREIHCKARQTLDANHVCIVVVNVHLGFLILLVVLRSLSVVYAHN